MHVLIHVGPKLERKEILKTLTNGIDLSVHYRMYDPTEMSMFEGLMCVHATTNATADGVLNAAYRDFVCADFAKASCTTDALHIKTLCDAKHTSEDRRKSWQRYADISLDCVTRIDIARDVSASMPEELKPWRTIRNDDDEIVGIVLPMTKDEYHRWDHNSWTRIRINGR
jgi:hypothetical protein